MKIPTILKTPVLTLAASMFFATTAPAQQTKLLTADKHNEYGLIYSLPNTAIDINVTATRTVRKAGPYYKYARKYLGTDKVVKEDSESWTVNSVTLRTRGVADTEETYLMQLKNGSLTYICVDADGMLLAINKDVPSPAGTPVYDPEAGAAKSDKVSMNEYLQYVDEDFIASQSSAKQAQMLAESLMEIRDAKISLTRGTAETMPTDGKQLELMLNSLSHQEAALTAAFAGLTQTEQVTRTYTVTPTKEGKKVLFRMSDFAGFVDSDDYSGDPVYLTIDIVSEPQIPVDAKGTEKKLPKDAVIYNIPGTVKATLSFLGRTLCEQEVELAQFGVKFGLNPVLFSAKKDRSFATFDPATGALREIGAESQAE